MAKFETSILINHPIEEVFEYVTNLRNNVNWMSSVVASAMTSEGLVKAGSTYKFDMKAMGMKLETTGEVTAYEPSEKYAWKAASGPFPMSGGSTYESADGGTLVTKFAGVEPCGFFKLAEPLLMKQQQSQMDADMMKLKEILEG